MVKMVSLYIVSLKVTESIEGVKRGLTIFYTVLITLRVY